MAVLKFKTFEALDRLEREGKGINWNFRPDKAYFRKTFRFRIKIPFPPGLYKFKTFEEAEIWERKWWIKSGATKRDR
jgi:hypothetical protein